MSYDEIADALGVRRAFVAWCCCVPRHRTRQALEGKRGAGGGRDLMSNTPEEKMKHLDEMTLLLYI